MIPEGAGNGQNRVDRERLRTTRLAWKICRMQLDLVLREAVLVLQTGYE